MAENTKIFQRNLLNLLNKYNKSQKEVADAIHVSPQTFNTWCQGIAIPRMGKIQLLADYFHVNMSDLIEKRDPAAADQPLPIASGAEAELVEKYRLLNPAGKQKLAERADELIDLGYTEKGDGARMA